MNLSAWLLALVLTGLAGAGGGYYFGHDNGKAEQIAASDAKLVGDLTGIVDSHQALIGQAQAASKAWRLATAARTRHDETTTKEIKNALAATADSRAGCVFDAGVMRQLAEARDRAADAAARGIRGALPGATASTGQP